MRYLFAAAAVFFAIAPAFSQGTMPSLDQIEWITSSPPQGKLQLVEFWATWCPPCRKSIPHLNEIHEKFQDKGLVVIGISDEAEEEIKNFIKDQVEMKYHVGRDPSGDIGNQLGITGIPTAFFVDNGTIIWSGHPANITDALVEEKLKFTESENFPTLNGVEWINTAPGDSKLQLVEFWATWCPPCRKSIPHLNEIHQKYGTTGLVVIGISGEPSEKIKDFMGKTPMNYSVGSDPKGAISASLKIEGIPTAFFVKSGKIVWRGHPMEISDEMIRGFGLKPAGEKDEYDLMMEKIITILNGFTQSLAKVKDEESAKSARSELKILVKQMNELQKEIETAPNPALEREALLKELYEKQLNDAAEKFTKEMMRVTMDPKLNKELGDILQELK